MRVDLREQAQDLAFTRRWHCVPVIVTDKGNGDKKVQPLIQWKGADSTSTEDEALEAMPWDKATHIAVVLERSGVAVVDIDDMESLPKLPPECRMTAWQATRKGRHYWYRRPAWRIGRNIKGLPGIDLLDEGLAILWNKEGAMDDELADWPFPKPAGISMKVGEGGRNHDLASTAGSMIREAPSVSLEQLTHKLFEYSNLSHVPPLSYSEVAAVARSILQKHRKADSQVSEPVNVTCYDMGELFATEFPPIRFVCDPFVAEGYTVYAGEPKIGKTTLMRQLMVAAHLGATFLGFDCQKSSGLFLSLEEGPRVFRDKLKRMGYSLEELRGLTVSFEWPRGAQGFSRLDEHMKAYPDTRLIVIDCLEAFKELAGNTRESPFSQDYQIGRKFQEFAKRYPGLALVVIHHTRKMETTNALHLVSGTMGVTAAADQICVLHKNPMGYFMHWQGRNWHRDDNDFEVARDGGRWRYIGEVMPEIANLHGNATGQVEIINYLRMSCLPCHGKAIALALGKSEPTISDSCRRLEDLGLIRKEKAGWVMN